MRVVHHREFDKRYPKLRLGEQEKFKERQALFIINSFDPVLRNHSLHGEYAGYRSIDITGDLRVHYKLLDENTAVFATIGTHHELYGK